MDWAALNERAVEAGRTAERAKMRAQELQLVGSARRGDFLVCCAWCGRLASPNGNGADEASRWRVGSPYVLRLPPSLRRHLSHSICPDCVERVGRRVAIVREVDAAAG